MYFNRPILSFEEVVRDKGGINIGEFQFTPGGALLQYAQPPPPQPHSILRYPPAFARSSLVS